MPQDESVHMNALKEEFLSTLSQQQAGYPTHLAHRWNKNPATLITSCRITNLILGTGEAIFKSNAGLIEAAEHEVILVTCYWSQSKSCAIINNLLKTLSEKAVRKGVKIRVRIGFSSSSLWQMLFHTQSSNGSIHPTGSLTQLGLLNGTERPGLDLIVKSIFIKPLSIMHPKFIVIDRQIVLLPSCNVSWENWFEGCITMRGPIVQSFIDFWHTIWATSLDKQFVLSEQITPAFDLIDEQSIEEKELPYRVTTLPKGEILCVFLPSPHHINPQFRIFPQQQFASPPPTPLNSFLLTAFAKAKKSIRIQTPNLTSPPVLQAVCDALKRGVNVNIITNEKAMTLEQLLTAGTTTNQCVRKLIKRYKKSWNSISNRQRTGLLDMEQCNTTPTGKLNIRYFKRIASESAVDENEPVVTHLKLSIIDEKIVILGSGNMDRASWYTSQELGVAFESVELATTLAESLNDLLKKRSTLIYDDI